MKKKINIFSNNKIKFFLSELLCDYETSFMNLEEIEKKYKKSNTNILILRNEIDASLINFKNLNDNFLILSNLSNTKLNLKKNIRILKTPVSIINIKTTIEKFLNNLKIHFHDISIVNEKMTNTINNSSCYLTSLEVEILTHLIKESETTKNFIKENILNIKADIETNSLESHLTRIRKKMNQINTAVKIQSKNEKLIIKV